MAIITNFDVEMARREYARPDGIIYLGGYDFSDYEPEIRPTPIVPRPWPFNLGPNGSFLVLLAMEAPFLIVAIIKWLTE